MSKPYIGITDFMTPEQVLQAVECIPANINRRLHVGHMMSWKTLNHVPTSTGWEHIWLQQWNIQKVFIKHPNVFNVLHYADYDDKTTMVDLMNAQKYGGQYLHAIQLDMKWPDPQLLRSFKAVFPTIKIIQQVGHTAIKESHDWERDLAAYEGIADYVLLDCGMGKGIPFTPEHMLELVETALMYFDEDQIAVAGGLGPYTYLNLKPVVDVYQDISCDAQGQMRTTNNATHPIEMDRVCAYIQGVCSLIR
jgi:hypothetical protein